VAELEAVWSSSVALATKHGSDPIAQRSELCEIQADVARHLVDAAHPTAPQRMREAYTALSMLAPTEGCAYMHLYI